MRGKGKFVFILLVLWFLSFQVVNAWEKDQTATVESVIDGDTFWISGKQVRLADIDAPEQGEDGYEEAKLALIKMIDDKKVYLDTDQMTGEDQYGRLVAVAYLKVDKCTFRNVNYNLWKVKKVAVLWDQDNNEFEPSTWESRVGPFEDSTDDCGGGDIVGEGIQKYALNIQINGQGTIDHPTDETIYEEGNTVSIRAEPKENWRLKEWMLNGEKMDNSDQITFILNQDILLKVYFEVIPPDSKILFNVYDSNIQPIEDAEIVSLTQPHRQLPINIKSGPIGFVETDFVYNGQYSFKISKTGYKTSELSLSLPKGEPLEQVVELVREKVRLSIQVKSPDGYPVKGAEIVSAIQPSNQAPITGITNEEGVVIFENIEPGKYSVEILGEHINQEQLEVETDLPGTTEFNIEQSIQVLSNIQVSVKDDKGIPISEVHVTSTDQPEGQEPLNYTINGEHVFKKVLPGYYRFSFEKENYHSSSLSISITEFERESIPKPVVLTHISFNYTPYILLASATCALAIGYYYQAYILENLSMPFRSKSEISQVKENLEESMLPFYYGSNKGKIIKTICVDDYHGLSDIREHSGLDERDFSDTFYDLLSKGELESTEKGLYLVRNDIKKHWLASW